MLASRYDHYHTERGYSAGVGEPVALFYRELAAVYPEAKFLLNTRDPHAW